MVEKNVKRSISAKIFLTLFSSIILLFFLILLIMVLALKNLATKESYYRLNNYVNISAPLWLEGKKVDKNIMVFDRENALVNLGIIQGKYVNDSLVIYDQELIQIDENLLSSTDLNTFLGQVKVGNNVFESSKGDIFYSCSIDVVSQNFIIFLIDDTYQTYFIKNIVLNIVIILTLSLILLGLVTSLWVSRLVKRIKNLQVHITSMHKEKYEKPYLDTGDDEIRELSESIEKLRVEIKNNETTKREMLQNVSHDFKTPIAVIKNYAEAIVDGVIDSSEAEIIVKQSDLLKSKVNQLLQYNRLEYLSKDKPFEKVNMKDVVTEVVNNNKLNNNINFILNLEDCIFEGYRENFVTIVENIVDNALRYAKTTIKITTKTNKMTIYNDGEPIEDKFLNTTFKPYEKGSKGVFGLGMSIVQKTVDFFNLKLKVYNENTGGVSFVISKEKEGL